MQKKIFLEKNMQPAGKQSYVKALLFATIGLVILAVIIPTFMRPKDPRQLSMERAFEKGGMVKREIPKSYMPSENRFPMNDSGERVANTMENTPSAMPDGKSTPDAREEKASQAPASQAPSNSVPGVALNEIDQGTGAAGWKSPSQDSTQAPSGSEMASVSGVLDKPSKETAPLPDAQKSAASAVTTALPGALPVEQEKQMTAKLSPEDKKSQKQPALPGVTPPTSATEGREQKPVVPKKETYAVQVGSYKEKQNAEEMRQSLQDKGYSVVIRSQNHPKLGQLYVVQLQPVKDAGRANTLMAQIQNVANVKPVIVKIPAPQQVSSMKE